MRDRAVVDSAVRQSRAGHTAARVSSALLVLAPPNSFQDQRSNVFDFITEISGVTMCMLACASAVHSQYAFDSLCSLTRCVSFFFFVFFKFLVFEAAMYANRDVYINRS